MPFESIEHRDLVTQGKKYIHHVYPDIKMLLEDTFSLLGTSRMVPLIQYQPDIVAELMDGRTIIGEAKTAKDILRPHSREQYKAFITYLNHRSPQGVFLLFCSWKVVTSAQDWLRTYLRRHLDTDITCLVVSDVDIMRLLSGSTY